MVETGTVAFVAAREAVLSLAARLDYPEVVYAGGRLAGETDYARAATEVRPGHIVELLEKLEGIRSSRQQQADNDERERQRAHDRRPLNLIDPDPSDLESLAEVQRRKWAAEDAQARAMPASHGDLLDLLEVTRAILARLENRAS